MIATARFDRDADYFDTFYAAWLKYRSRYRRFAVLIWSIVLFLSAASVFLGYGRPIICGIIVGSAFSLAEVLTYRWRWKRKVAKMGLSEWMEIKFDDEVVHYRTPLGDGKVSYDAFRKFVPTPLGLFIVQAVGLSWFVPVASIDPQARLSILIQHLERRINDE